MISRLIVGGSRALRVSPVLGATGFITKKGRQATNTRLRSLYETKIAARSDLHSTITAFSKLRNTKQRQHPKSPADSPFEQIIMQSIADCLATFEPLDVEANRVEMDKEHQRVLSSFWKTSLAFNPLSSDASIDVRFMPLQVQDSVHKMLENRASNPRSINWYYIRAMAGAGKTAAVLNAVGRKEYLIYCQGDTFESSAKDYDDNAMAQFVDELLDGLGLQKSVEDATSIATAYCRVFWLVRLMILDHMKNHYNFTPEMWNWWINGKGMKVLEQVQKNALEHLFYSLHGEEDICSEVLFLLQTYLDKYPKVWFAIDDAQELVNCPAFSFISPFCQWKMNLLDVFTVLALPQDVLTIVLGTQLSSYEGMEMSSNAKGSRLYNFSTEMDQFPYVTADQAMKILNNFLDLNGVSVQNITKAKTQLQGRLLHVVVFVKHLYDETVQYRKNTGHTGPLTEKQKDEIFALVLQSVNARLQRVTKQCQRIKAKLGGRNHEKQSVGLQKFHVHLLMLLLNYLEGWPTKYEASQFEDQFGMTPEETGFLFLDKEQKGVYSYSSVYSIQEPQMVPYVVKELEDYYGPVVNTLLEHPVGPSSQGYYLEKVFGILMCSPSFPPFLKAFSAPSWCTDASFKWQQIIQSNDPLLLEAAAVVKSLAEAAKKNPPANELVQFFLQSRILALLASNGVPMELIPVFIEIAKEEDERAGELVFLLAQPTKYLLRPTPALGPDLVGFFESGSKKALVAVSMSCSPSDSKKAVWQKFEQNKQRQRPANFYSGNPSQQILQHMNLPEKSLLISATMPSFMEAQKQETDSMVQIFLNESTIANLSNELSQTLKQWISLYERAHGKRRYE